MERVVTSSERSALVGSLDRCGCGTVSTDPPFSARGKNVARFFFHVRKGGELECDALGLELPDFASARQQAIRAARDLLADMATRGQDARGWTIEIADEDGVSLDWVPLPDMPMLQPMRPHAQNDNT